MSNGLFILDPVSEQYEFLSDIEPSVFIGKSETVDAKIDDWHCDGVHAFIESKDTKFKLIDLGSRYGTYVNGKRICNLDIDINQPFNIGSSELCIRKIDSSEKEFLESKKMFEFEALLNSSIKADDAKEKKNEKKLLEITYQWSSKRLETLTFLPKSKITIGSKRSNTFSIPFINQELNKKPYLLARYTKKGLTVNIPKDIIGIVWSQKSVYSLDYVSKHLDTLKINAKKQFNPTLNQKHLQLFLNIGDKLYLEFGELSLFFQFKPQSEKLPTPFFPKIDKNIKRIIQSVLGFYILVILILSLPKIKEKEKTLKDVPEHLKKVLYDAGVAEAEKVRQAAIGQIAKTLEGGRARAEEGKSSAKKTKVKKEVKKISPQKTPVEKAKLIQPTLVDMESAFKAISASTVVATPSMIGVPKQGNTVSSLKTKGFARGTKGLGAGGGGQSVGVGALKGTQRGGGLGSGNSGLLPSKGREIDIPETEVIEIEGGLDRDVIAAIIKRYLPQIQHCYEQGLVIKPSIKGKVTVVFTINAKGGVSSAKVIETSLKHKSTEACIIKKIKKWKFPKPKGGVNVGVKYPFLLMSSDR